MSDVIKSLVKETIKHICKKFEGRQLSYRPWYRVVRTGDSEVSFPLELRPDPDRVMSELIEAVNALPYVKDIYRVARSKPEICASLLTDAGGKPIQDVHFAEQC